MKYVIVGEWNNKLSDNNNNNKASVICAKHKFKCVFKKRKKSRGFDGDVASGFVSLKRHVIYAIHKKLFSILFCRFSQISFDFGLTIYVILKSKTMVLAKFFFHPFYCLNLNNNLNDKMNFLQKLQLWQITW